MSKESLLQEVTLAGQQNALTEAELLSAFRAGQTVSDTTGVKTITKHLSVAEVLYYIGGAIVFIGIVILAYQNWNDFNTPTRILVTLGSSIAAYIMGVMFMQYQKLQTVAQSFFLIAMLVAPLGLGVTFHEAGMSVSEHSVQTMIAVILLALSLSSFILFKQAVFVIYSIIFGSWFYFSVTSLMIGTTPTLPEYKFYEYRVLLLGISYILLGYSFLQRQLAALTGWLYGFGILGFLGAALALGGWSPEQNMFWELVFPGLTLGAIFMGVYLKSRALLTFGAAFIMIYILKITAEYFTHTMGWPIALVIAGLALIAVGYLTFYLNNKYISKSAA